MLGENRDAVDGHDAVDYSRWDTNDGAGCVENDGEMVKVVIIIGYFICWASHYIHQVVSTVCCSSGHVCMVKIPSTNSLLCHEMVDCG